MSHTYIYKSFFWNSAFFRQVDSPPFAYDVGILYTYVSFILCLCQKKPYVIVGILAYLPSWKYFCHVQTIWWSSQIKILLLEYKFFECLKLISLVQ